MQNHFLLQNKTKVSLALIVLFLLTLFSFFPCFKGEFLNWDDEGHLTSNRVVRALFVEDFSQGLKNIFTQKVNRTYHPLTTLSFALEYYFSKSKPFLYHLNNFLLHLAVVFLVFSFSRKIGLSIFASTIVAIFFSIHPTRVESVAWITERKDVLYAFFYMLALNFYWKYLEEKKIWFYVATIVLGIFSILSKAMALSLPIILLLCDWFYGRKITKKIFLEKIPIFLYVALIAGITYAANARFPGESIYEAVLTWLWTFTFYFEKFVYPKVLIPIYNLPEPVSIKNLAFMTSVGISVVLMFVLYLFRRCRWFLFSLGFYFFSIFFLMRFDSGYDTQVVADRFLYLPSLGFCFLIGFGLDRIFLFGKECYMNLKRIIIVAVLLVLILGMSAKTFKQSKIWENNILLWTHQVQNSNKGSVPFNNLAVSYVAVASGKEYLDDVLKYQKKIDGSLDNYSREGEMEKIRNIEKVDNVAQRAMILLTRSIFSEPVIPEAYSNLANLYEDMGFINEAIELHEKSIFLDSQFIRSYYFLGKIYRNLGQDQKAVNFFWDALHLKPRDTWLCAKIIKSYNEVIEERRKAGKDAKIFEDAREKVMVLMRDLVIEEKFGETNYETMGRIYEDIGDFASAASAYGKALRKKEEDPNTFLALANVYYQEGQIDRAIKIYEELLGKDAKNKKIFLNLGAAYNKKGQFKKAIEYYNDVLVLSPDDPRAYFNLGYVYENMGKDEESISFYKKVLELDPLYEGAYYNIASIYTKKGEVEKAIDLYKRVISINGRHIDALVNLSILSFYQKNFDLALEYYDRAFRLGYNPPNRYQKAIEKYREEGEDAFSSFQELQN